MMQKVVLKPIFPNKPKKVQPQPELETKMIARVSHDDIEVWEPKRSCR